MTSLGAFTRRAFVGAIGGAMAASVVGDALGLPSLLTPQVADAADLLGPLNVQRRQQRAYQFRIERAAAQRSMVTGSHLSNGDEGHYPTKIGNFSKALPHNALGEVTPAAYASLIKAITSGRPADYESITMGLGRRLTSPQGALAFSLEGPDSCALTQRPAPPFASAEIASEITENYWMALTRDVPFTAYDTNPLCQQAAAELSGLGAFRGPRNASQVTTGTLFRGALGGPPDKPHSALNGPYVSQLMWLAAPFGAEYIERRMRTTVPGLNYMTTYPGWLAVQNGADPTNTDSFDSVRRYIRNGRDLGQWVHMDVLFQAYFTAVLILMDLHAPLDASNPYNTSHTQAGFATLGEPFIDSLVCGVARQALQAVWFQKWQVHRRLRPEAFAGAIHNHKTGATAYDLHSTAVDSDAVAAVFSTYGSYLLPMAFPEGSPTHPSYGAGHATVAGACVTILKAYFDEMWEIPHPVISTPDGLGLVPYEGEPLTVGCELNKLAENVAFGRNIAGVHWRSDAMESLKLGEELAIRYLRDEKACMNEAFAGFSLTKFDGTTITV